MASHALYGMTSCFGHTGVTFDVENDRPGPGSLRGHFEAARGHFFRLKALVLLEVQCENCYTIWIYTTLLLSSRNIHVCMCAFVWLPE